MAGHSKWANIKHKKAKADQKKGKVFSRIIKEIIQAVKQGGSDPKTNTKLKLVLQKAKEANLPSDTIERNIKKATQSDQNSYHEVSYELYGYGKVGVLVEGMTDNKNRMASEIRIAVNKCGGSMASIGSVSYNFERKAVIQTLSNNVDENELFLTVSESGAEDFEKVEDVYIITTSPDDLYKVKESIDRLGIKNEARIEMIPKMFAECSEEDQKRNMELIDFLENLEDVDTVYHNMKM